MNKINSNNQQSTIIKDKKESQAKLLDSPVKNKPSTSLFKIQREVLQNLHSMNKFDAVNAKRSEHHKIPEAYNNFVMNLQSQFPDLAAENKQALADIQSGRFLNKLPVEVKQRIEDEFKTPEDGVFEANFNDRNFIRQVLTLVANIGRASSMKNNAIRFKESIMSDRPVDAYLALGSIVADYLNIYASFLDDESADYKAYKKFTSTVSAVDLLATSLDATGVNLMDLVDEKPGQISAVCAGLAAAVLTQVCSDGVEKIVSNAIDQYVD